MRDLRVASLVLMMLPLSTAACGGTGSGKVEWVLEAEASIPDGLDPGTLEENVMDGWAIRYTKYLQTVGAFKATTSAGDGEPIESAPALLLDMKALPAGGQVIATFADVAAVRYDQVEYSSPAVGASVEKGAGVSQADFDMMKAANANLFATGTATKGAKTVNFTFLIPAASHFTNCGPETGDKGFAVVDGGTTQATATYHGDHFWFNAFPAGTEGTIVRLGEWLNRADANADGTVTPAELDAGTAAVLFPSPEFNLGGSPVPVTNGTSFLKAQGVTVGHFQGEGECDFAPL
jgi:hypothetical protein